MRIVARVPAAINEPSGTATRTGDLAAAQRAIARVETLALIAALALPLALPLALTLTLILALTLALSRGSGSATLSRIVHLRQTGPEALHGAERLIRPRPIAGGTRGLAH